VNIWPKFWNS